jgi:hypothetical protein
VISPVKLEAQLTSNVSVVVASAVKPLVIVAPLVTARASIVALADVRASMSALAASKAQDIVTFPSAVTFQVN